MTAPTTTPPIDLDQMERDAVKRLTDYIARIAGQQMRRMRESWRAEK